MRHVTSRSGGAATAALGGAGYIEAEEDQTTNMPDQQFRLSPGVCNPAKEERRHLPRGPYEPHYGKDATQT